MSWQEECRRRGGTVTRQPHGAFTGQLACRLPTGYELAPILDRAKDNLEYNGQAVQIVAGNAAEVATSVQEAADLGVGKLSQILLAVAAIGVVYVAYQFVRK